ncbi:neuronal acetylcholine receptor subunit alpha-2-like [Pecten maximus]|uniref:neuronal acetylcholine receptor subunit alpha-2-like n=1 Tax=Pecten maximus TaxID=6579 RepID=UPI001458C40C|nr:neuronal acetylcholine receptor subunit alpha-2-like [Pecten maximus]
MAVTCMLSLALFWSSLLCLVPSSLQDGAAGNMDRELQHILQNYNKVLSPATRDNQTVLVKHGITVTRIVDLKDDVMTLDIWQDMEWTDVRLRWMADDVLRQINIATDLIWVPDIVLYNSGGISSYLHPPDTRQAHVLYDGTVFVSSALRLHVWCGNANGSSPVDQDGTYTCNLKFGSWGYDGFRMDLHGRMDDVDLSSLSEHRQWRVKSTSMTRNVVLYSCCPEPFLDLSYTIQLEPKYGPC